MDAPKDKHDLMERIRNGREELQILLRSVSPDEMLIPLEDNWSIKDFIAHIVIWEKRMVEWLNIVKKGGIPQQLPPGMTWDDLDSWNEQAFEENRGRELMEVLAEFERLAEEVTRAVEAIPEHLLMRADSLEWRSGSPLWEMVAANTYWHYPEHHETIMQWLESRIDGK